MDLEHDFWIPPKKILTVSLPWNFRRNCSTERGKQFLLTQHTATRTQDCGCLTTETILFNSSNIVQTDNFRPALPRDLWQWLRSDASSIGNKTIRLWKALHSIRGNRIPGVRLGLRAKPVKSPCLLWTTWQTNQHPHSGNPSRFTPKIVTSSSFPGPLDSNRPAHYIPTINGGQLSG